MNTKLKGLLVLALVAVSSMAFSQVQFAVGLKAGPNFANLDVKDPGATYSNRTGWHGGAFVNLKFGKVAIQPEVLFSQQGSKVKFNTDDLNSNFNYINIPVIVKLYTIAGINLQVGPQFGFLTNDPKAVVDGQTVESAYKDSDVSVAMGVGWDLPFGLTVDGRYNLGLTKIEEAEGVETTKNQVWQVSLGYKIFKSGRNRDLTNRFSRRVVRATFFCFNDQTDCSSKSTNKRAAKSLSLVEPNRTIWTYRPKNWS